MRLSLRATNVHSSAGLWAQLEVRSVTKIEEPTPGRRNIMRAIRSKDTRPELVVRRLLHQLGYRYRLHLRTLPGRPDIVFTRRRVALFVHGCFWHHHLCQAGRLPRRNATFWLEKIRRNVARDSGRVAALKEMGWSVEIVWECELNDLDRLRARLRASLGPPRLA